MTNSIKCNITAFGGVIKTKSKDVRVSNTSIEDIFLSIIKDRVPSTPLLPAGCVQYVYSNCTHIVAQVFELGTTNLRYVVRPSDIADDMRAHPEWYRAICPDVRIPEGFSMSSSNTVCARCDNCADCSFNNHIFHTTDYAYPGYIIEFTKIPLPKILFTTILGERGSAEKYYFIRKCYIHAIQDEVLSPNTNVYSFPFGNLYEDGSVCWGDNVFEPATNLLFLDNVLTKYFTATPFNNDLDPRDGYDNLRSMLSIRVLTTLNLYKYLSRQYSFPGELFSCLRAPETYSDFIDRLSESFIASFPNG